MEILLAIRTIQFCYSFIQNITLNSIPEVDLLLLIVNEYKINDSVL